MVTPTLSKLDFPQLDLNAEQTKVLVSLGYQVTERLMQISFEDPVRDQAMIRFHAKLHGKLEAIHQLLGYDVQVAEKVEESIRRSAFGEDET